MTRKTLTIREPGDFVDAIPTLIGFNSSPGDLIIIGISTTDRVPHIRVDRPASRAEWSGLLHACIKAYGNADRVTFAVIGHAAPELADATGDAVDITASCLADLGKVVAKITMTGHVWHDAVSDTQGLIAVDPQTPRNRDALAEHVAPNGSDIEPDAFSDYDRARALLSAPTANPARDDIATLLGLAGGSFLGNLTLTETRTREQHQAALDMWLAVTRAAAPRYRGRAALCAAWHAYNTGNGALAWVCIDIHPATAHHHLAEHIADAITNCRQPAAS